MSERKIKIGVLGCASIAHRYFIPAILASGLYELVAVASRHMERAAMFAERFNCMPIEGYENLLERNDIEAVYIPLPTGLHAEWGLKALNKGKHVIMEKSLATNIEDARNLIETAKAKGLALMEDFMFMYHSQHNFVFDQLKSGAIGDIRCFRASFGFPPFRDENNIRYSKELGGGALLDAGAYTIKAAQFVLGKGLKVKAAHLVYDEKKGVDIYGGAFLSNEKGLFAEVAFGFDNFYQCNFEIWGNKGKLTADRAFTAAPGFKPKILIEKQDEHHTFTLPADNHFVNILKEFHLTITERKFNHQYEALLDQAVLLQNVFSHATH